MPANLTLLDIAVMNGSDPLVGLIDETIKAYPEIQGGDARTIKGINYKTLVRTVLPSVSFRAANSGGTVVKGTYENRLVETYIFNPRWEADKAVADSHEDGPEAAIAVEADGIMQASMQTLAKVFYYGQDATLGDALGFPGLLAMYDTANMEVDAGGTTDSVASSCWMVRWGSKDVQWVWGQNGQLAMSDVTQQRVTDSNSNPYTAYIQEVLARPGLQVGNKFAIGRIKKITTDSGKGLTDALLGKLFAKFKVGFPPDVIYCSRRSLEQLRASRTATNPTGAPAPTPTDWNGIPIKVTDSILDTELLAS